jgi:L-lysine exporter family protein LysE/ArgO
MEIFISVIEGFAMGAGLIIAIGAQNAFVLKQGIKGEYRTIIAIICSVCDAILIICGIAGMGVLFSSYSLITKIISFSGAAYLAWFSLKSFHSAVKGDSMNIDKESFKSLTLKSAVTTTLVLTFLNPHVYLDTVVMLGSFGAARPPEIRPFFGIGAVSASFAWFFALAFSGKLLAPLFKKERAWRVLDTAIGILMIYIAVNLLIFGINL